MLKISFELSLGRSLYWTFLKLDMLIGGTMENWSCIVFGPNQPLRRGGGFTQIIEFLENESLTTDFTETYQVSNLL